MSEPVESSKRRVCLGAGYVPVVAGGVFASLGGFQSANVGLPTTGNAPGGGR